MQISNDQYNTDKADTKAKQRARVVRGNDEDVEQKKCRSVMSVGKPQQAEPGDLVPQSTN